MSSASSRAWRTTPKAVAALAASLLGLSAPSAWPAPAPAPAPSVLEAPIRTVPVAWGRIGYRVVGRGRPLVLVAGASGSIDGWAPAFVDALARHHRVYAFDNEGVGDTTLQPGTLTISRMGDDAAAFVAALRLKRPDVLGWSMGGAVVEALAVRHPGSVRRIVLCGAVPGDGTGMAPRGVRRTPPDANMFPADRDAARRAFIRDLGRYPRSYMAPPAVTQAQKAAADGWLHGLEPAGHHLRSVRARALIADGDEDPYDPIANSRTLAAEIPRAALHIYADAAHAFWFQDLGDWVRRVDRFLR